MSFVLSPLIKGKPTFKVGFVTPRMKSVMAKIDRSKASTIEGPTKLMHLSIKTFILLFLGVQEKGDNRPNAALAAIP